MKQFCCVLAFICAMACSPKKEKDPKPAPTEIGDTTITDPVPTADNSLDYIGRYQGPLEGTTMAIELSEDFTYDMTLTKPNGKSVSHTSGTFKWNTTGDGIELSQNGKISQRFLVDGSFLVMTDDKGARLNPKNAGEFVLTKQSETQAAKSDGTPMDDLPLNIAQIHWILSEVNGRVIKQPDNQEYFIQLNKDGSFGAFAGCNRMGGKYELKGSKVRMFEIISTMMACPEMKLEDEFKSALESADNFVANKKVLQFRKGGSNLLKFEAVTLPKP